MFWVLCYSRVFCFFVEVGKGFWVGVMGVFLGCVFGVNIGFLGLFGDFVLVGVYFIGVYVGWVVGGMVFW